LRIVAARGSGFLQLIVSCGDFPRADARTIAFAWMDDLRAGRIRLLKTCAISLFVDSQFRYFGGVRKSVRDEIALNCGRPKNNEIVNSEKDACLPSAPKVCNLLRNKNDTLSSVPRAESRLVI
jgi:hypothetical protein